MTWIQRFFLTQQAMLMAMQPPHRRKMTEADRRRLDKAFGRKPILMPDGTEARTR